MPRGRSAVSIHSDSSDVDIDGVADSEMAKLLRQFRIMEGDRQAYGVQAQELIRRQRLEIEKLQKEQQDLQHSLRASESLSQRQRDVAAAQAMRGLLERCDGVDAQLEQERQRLAQMEQEIVSTERQLTAVRRSGNSADPQLRSKAYQKEKVTRTLENKLDRALVRFNEQLGKNTQLRAELETLRVERIRFQHLQRKLDKELQDIHRDIGEVINQSTNAYDSRVEAQSKMVILKEKAVRDLTQYSAEMKELERNMAHEQDLKVFMSTKSNERNIQEGGLRPGRRQGSEPQEQRRADSRELTMDSLEEMFLKIHSVTGEEDLELLVTKFIQVEDRNFALFNYINEQNNEVEALQDQIGQVQREMEEFQAEGRAQEAKRHSRLRDFEAKLREAESQAQAFESQATAASKILDQLKTGVCHLFHELNCDRSVIEDMLDSSAGITDNNIMNYLTMVEQKTNELLTIQAFLSSKDIDNEYDAKDVAQILLGQGPDMPSQNVLVQPPGSGDGYDTEESLLTDEDERPLTRQELRQRIMKGVLRKDRGIRLAVGKESRSSRIDLVSSSHLRFQEADVTISPPPC
ncbi:coiled-coil domain-containing protein 114 [Brienomyrus brachyistius]|uniref:coiled-coil domain-containing protein 114 n=1 Tax=Brienomyrus brachyistius TaxID=42636 RepID=UPI0020B270D4|nr:coiled-coil domain-containing protein 114 [Brienomyrus brachyistius]XP_048880084.1 coiled-coil domain-containing protein 114 [Brienomyrus brachyistius]XP_048880085.1 coiled-coil domain-containing protein 114 [Brienomyrus brachyistius]